VSAVSKVEALQRAAPDQAEVLRQKLHKLDSLALRRHKEALSASKTLVIAGEAHQVPDHEQRNRALDRQFKAVGVATPPPAAPIGLGLAVEIDPITGITRVVAITRTSDNG